MQDFDDFSNCISRPAKPDSEIAGGIWNSFHVPDTSSLLPMSDDLLFPYPADEHDGQWPENALVLTDEIGTRQDSGYPIHTSTLGDISAATKYIVPSTVFKVGEPSNEPTWALKNKHPLQKQCEVRSQSAQLLEKPFRSMATAPIGSFEFPQDIGLNFSTSPDLMSHMLSASAEDSLRDYSLRDINPSECTFGVHEVANSTITTVVPKKEPAPETQTIGSGVAFREENSGTRSAQEQPAPSLNFDQATGLDDAQDFIDSLAELDFHFDGSSLQASSAKVSSASQVSNLPPDLKSSTEVMARAAAAVAAGECDDGDKQWACEMCSSRFSIKGHLSQHHRYVHEKYRPHRCPFRKCDASFGTRFARSQHIWTVHENLKPFHCNFGHCKSSFGQRSHLNRHRKRHLKSLNAAAPSKKCTEFNETGSFIPSFAERISPTLVAAAAARSVSRPTLAASSAAIPGNMVRHVASNAFGPLPPSVNIQQHIPTAYLRG